MILPQLPPLPSVISQENMSLNADEPWRGLRGGCWLLRWFSNESETSNPIYEGTFRVEKSRNHTSASGDLYKFNRKAPAQPQRGIPVFAVADYRFYLKLNDIEVSGQSGLITLVFRAYRYDAAGRSWSAGTRYRAEMQWAVPPLSYPRREDYLAGNLKDRDGVVVGRLTLGWLHPSLRRAVIEIDRVRHSEAPLNNGSGETWRSIFAQVGWDVHVIESDRDVIEPSGAYWSDAEMHALMMNHRDQTVSLDREWRYYLLCVRRLESTSRGIMFDAYGGDANQVPREGAGIASHWIIPDQVRWGRVRGRRFGEATAPYFRTAVHELGHAMGLYHNSAGNGFMNTTGTIAGNALPGEFPDNVLWRFAADDVRRLRHMPDIWVRPGGLAFGSAYGSVPLEDVAEQHDGLQVKVTPLSATIPLGAPVRVRLSLTNTGDRPIAVPASLSLKGGFVQGWVTSPGGNKREFAPLKLALDEEELVTLAPGESLGHELTLLRGREGALFGGPGLHRISFHIHWHDDEMYMAEGEGSVLVVGAQNEDHAEAALAVLREPQTLLALAIGGDHLTEGWSAIHAALNNPILKPHFAFFEARRVARGFGDRKGDPVAGEALVKDAVLSDREKEKAAAFGKYAESEDDC